MELSNLNGKIIAVIMDTKQSDISNKLVRDIVLKKPEKSLKMVGLSSDFLDRYYDELSISEKNKVVLASKLFDDIIILNDFSKGLTKKEKDFFKVLFKKIVTYNKKIVLVGKDSDMFLDCVLNYYVVVNDKIILETNDIYDDRLSKYIKLPNVVSFVQGALSYGVKINHYKEFDELLKAIYRILS